MQAYRTRARRGFTLVEILIVVIILGILAAIVIPQFTNASQDARKNSVTSQLQTIRSQVELYKLQHLDKLPALLTDWTQLTGRTDQNGTTSGTLSFGPYLQQYPKNPMNGNSTVLQSGAVGTTGYPTAATGAAGFVFDYSSGTGTGKIWATDQNGTSIYVE
jgi:general secretion pathway protein G